MDEHKNKCWPKAPESVRKLISTDQQIIIAVSTIEILPQTTSKLVVLFAYTMAPLDDADCDQPTPHWKQFVVLGK